MKHKEIFLLTSVLLMSPLASCRSFVNGRINFDLDGGIFTEDAFQTTYIEGQAGTPIKITIPDPVKDGYYFVGWREKDSSGAYRVINKRLASDGNSYFYYPYGSDTFYAYFEPLTTLTFHLGDDHSEATLVAPENGAASFQGNVLSGYASKEIPNANYLPTAEDKEGHSHFQYWYTEYPLAASTDSNSQKHYSLDTSGTRGQYRFDESFGNDSMAFPMDTNLDLYAYWKEDPTITVYMGIEGIESYTFQAEGSIETELTAMMKEKFGIDYSVSASNYYYTYPETGKKYRFAGFYLDSEYKSLFALTSPIADSNISLYLKWDVAINVTFDYNGGTLNGETSHTIENIYFSGDFLGSSLLTTYTPTKEDGTFTHYALNDKTFSFENDALPAEDVTLVAQYEAKKKLLISFDYPTSYTGEKQADVTYYFDDGESIVTSLASAKALVTDTDLLFRDTEIEDSSGNRVSNPYTYMPDKDLTVYSVYDYNSKVKISTYYNPSGDYEEYASSAFEADGFTVDASGNITTNSITLASFHGIEDALTVDSVTYLYDGAYSDTALTSPIIFPLVGEMSHSEMQVIQGYRKMTKAVTLTFYNYADRDSETKTSLGSLPVLPLHTVDDYSSPFASLLNTNGNTYSKLYVKNGDSYSLLTSLTPSADSDVYVEYQA